MTRGRTASLVLLLALLISMLLSLCLGAGDVSLPEALFGSQDSVAARILYYVRLPRMLAAVLAGASLSVAGLLLQAALGNPLAAPSIVGVNSGGTLLHCVCGWRVCVGVRLCLCRSLPCCIRCVHAGQCDRCIQDHDHFGRRFCFWHAECLHGRNSNVCSRCGE